MSQGDGFAKCTEREVFIIHALKVGREFGGVGLERGDDVFIGRRDQSLTERTFALLDDRRRSPGAFCEALQSTERGGQHLLATTRHLGGGARGLRVQRHQFKSKFALVRRRAHQLVRQGGAPTLVAVQTRRK